MGVQLMYYYTTSSQFRTEKLWNKEFHIIISFTVDYTQDWLYIYIHALLSSLYPNYMPWIQFLHTASLVHGSELIEITVMGVQVTYILIQDWIKLIC